MIAISKTTPLMETKTVFRNLESRKSAYHTLKNAKKSLIKTTRCVKARISIDIPAT